MYSCGPCSDSNAANCTGWFVDILTRDNFGRFSLINSSCGELLKQKNVLTVHGSGFGTKYGGGHFRLVFLPHMEILESAMNKIEDFVR